MARGMHSLHIGQVRVVIREIDKLREHGPKYSEGGGICANLDYMLPMQINGYQVVVDLAEGWEHHTGCNVFPIPQADMQSVFWGYKWKGEQLRYRNSMLDHMRKKAQSFLV